MMAGGQRAAMQVRERLTYLAMLDIVSKAQSGTSEVRISPRRVCRPGSHHRPRVPRTPAAARWPDRGPPTRRIRKTPTCPGTSGSLGQLAVRTAARTCGCRSASTMHRAPARTATPWTSPCTSLTGSTWGRRRTLSGGASPPTRPRPLGGLAPQASRNERGQGRAGRAPAGRPGRGGREGTAREARKADATRPSTPRQGPRRTSRPHALGCSDQRPRPPPRPGPPHQPGGGQLPGRTLVDPADPACADSHAPAGPDQHRVQRTPEPDPVQPVAHLAGRISRAARWPAVTPCPAGRRYSSGASAGYRLSSRLLR